MRKVKCKLPQSSHWKHPKQATFPSMILRTRISTFSPQNNCFKLSFSAFCWKHTQNLSLHICPRLWHWAGSEGLMTSWVEWKLSNEGTSFSCTVKPNPSTIKSNDIFVAMLQAYTGQLPMHSASEGIQVNFAYAYSFYKQVRHGGTCKRIFQWIRLERTSEISYPKLSTPSPKLHLAAQAPQPSWAAYARVSAPLYWRTSPWDPV